MLNGSFDDKNLKNAIHTKKKVQPMRFDVFIGLIVSMTLTSPQALAGYEFATRVNPCSDGDGVTETDKIDKVNDGASLRLPLGVSNLELWGDGIDFATRAIPTPESSDTASTEINIVKTRGGGENLVRCGLAKGSMEVTFTNGPRSANHFTKDVRFKDSGGAIKANLPISVRRFVAPDKLSLERLTGDCSLLRTLGRGFDGRSLTLGLLAVADREQASVDCSGALKIRIVENQDDSLRSGNLQASSKYNLNIEGLPPFLSPASIGVNYNWRDKEVLLVFNEERLRQLTQSANFNIFVSAPNGRRSNLVTLNMQILPRLIGFAGDITAFPQSLNILDPVDVRIPVTPAAPQGGQRILFTANTASCFDLSQHPDAPDIADPNVREFRITAGQTVGTLTLRSIQGDACSTRAPGTLHTIKAFFPDSDPVSCQSPRCSTTSVRLISPLP
jgi:hypothetical protein